MSGKHRQRSELSLPAERELPVSQATLLRIARRAMQAAIVAAGMLAVLLVFSRQAHAATSPPPSATQASLAPVTAPKPAAPVTSAGTGSVVHSVTSAVATVTSATTPKSG